MSGIDWDLVRRTAEKVDGWPEWKKGSPKNERTAAMTTKEQIAKKYAEQYAGPRWDCEIGSTYCPICDHHKSGRTQLDCDCLQRAESLILSALQEAEQWVSVSERLPEDGKWVLISEVRENGERYHAEPSWYSSKHGFYQEYDQGFGGYPAVTHWRPLPSPPEGK